MPTPQLRHPPVQARSHQRLQLVLDAADALLAQGGVRALTTTRVAERAGIPIGSVYRFYDNKQAIVEELALRHWEELVELAAAALAGAGDPVAAVLRALAAGFRARPGFLALWYGGLRTERVRDVTRPVRARLTAAVAQALRERHPRAGAHDVAAAADMAVLAGDGLLREAFRRQRDGDPTLLAESGVMLSAYLTARLGPPA